MSNSVNNVPISGKTNLPVDKVLLNINELCDYLGIGQTKAREILRGQNGFGVQIGNRWYANKRRLDEWIDRKSV